MGNSETKHYSSPAEPTATVRTVAPIRVETGESLTNADKPEATEKELKSVLHVVKYDFHKDKNNIANRTDMYDCTSKRKDEGFGADPELVVRRGGTFNMTLTFDRDYSLEDDDMQIMLNNGGRPERHASTNGRFLIDETGKCRYSAGEWGGKLLKKDGASVTFEIHVAADCAIGHWKFLVLTKSKVKEDTVKVFQYECPEEFIVLFNPWCPDDSVYMENTPLLDEYVLNDHGAVYMGNAYWPRGKPWNFGQFEDGILEICLYLIKKCFTSTQRHCLSDPIKVARAIAQVVNCNDRDEGVLCGNWSGEYDDGASPGSWSGSVKILKQHFNTKEMVKYGQCWVFSAVTTTVCRAVGIPALSLTNFSSAHDHDENTIIEKFYRRTAEGDLESDGGDSVWNFHVWNQVWMRRPDLEDPLGKYDGWQAIDATPQEYSGGVYRCGPAPLAAIREGRVAMSYDTAFVFAEVNSDELYLERSHGQLRKLKHTTNKVGKAISTKKPDGKRFVWTSKREDITHLYKHPDDSQESRNAVMRAARGARRVSEFYTGDPDTQDVEFKLTHEANLVLGSAVDVKLTVRNVSEYRRTLGNVQFCFYATKYTGNTGKCIKKDLQRVYEELVPNEVYEYTCRLPVCDYMASIDDNRAMTIMAFATVQKSATRPVQHCFKQHVVNLQEPDMDVKMPESAKVGEKFEASISFQNPLDEELTECLVGYEGRGFEHVTDVKQANIPPKGLAEVKFIMTGQKKGHFNLTFNFNSKQLHFLSGTGEVTIESSGQGTPMETGEATVQ